MITFVDFKNAGLLSKQNHIITRRFNSSENKKYKDWFYSRFPDLSKEEDTKEILYRLLNGFEECPKCLHCGKEIDFNKGFRYRNFCSMSCQAIYNTEKRNETNLKKYGVKSKACLPEVREKIKKTNLERYGAEHNWSSPEVREKIKKTNLERYGYEQPLACPEIRAKGFVTLAEKYDVESAPIQNPEIKARIEQTNLERYGATSPWSKDSILYKEIREKYLAKLPETKEKIARTNLEKYGHRCVFGNPEVRRKAKETLEKKYGVSCMLSLPEVHEKIDRQKARETMIRNGNAKSSRVENLLYDVLVKAFGESDIIKEHNKDPRYPWHCDFYIKSRDFFVELQGFYTHGTHPFDLTNPDDVVVVAALEEKGWSNVIDIWCNSDVKKRNHASEKRLNYLEIFDIDIEKIAVEIISIIKEKSGYQLIL